MKQGFQRRQVERISLQFLHRVVVANNEPCKCGIKDDTECLYCGERDSMEDSCQKWCNGSITVIMPSDQEYLFGIINEIKFTLLCARYFICTNKLHNNYYLITDFASKISTRYIIKMLA